MAKVLSGIIYTLPRLVYMKHQQSINYRSRHFQLPLEPDAEQALETWTTTHRVATTRLFLQFGKLHMAVNAQKAGSTLAELKELLSKMEDEMLEWYLELADGIVAKLQDGYGGPATISKYYTAIEAGAEHQQNYHRLRLLFNKFLDE